MLSICIPIYNVIVIDLITELKKQAMQLNVAIEIVCIDDCSKDNIRIANSETCNRLTKYFELSENIGRSKIRNLFLKHVQYDYLLFLDCDVSIDSPVFLSNYVNEIQINKFDVVCGGHIYRNESPKRMNKLKWLYASKKECRPIEIRKSNGFKSFISCNFAISKRIFSQLPFEEKLTGYGHEDTLFGFELSKVLIQLRHIDNVVTKYEMEENAIFIRKTEQAIDNLCFILKLKNDSEDFMNHVTLLRFYEKCKKNGLKPFVSILYFLCGRSVKALLSHGIVNLTLFDFYKLGYLSLKIKK